VSLSLIGNRERDGAERRVRVRECVNLDPHPVLIAQDAQMFQHDMKRVMHHRRRIGLPVGEVK